MGDSSPQNVTTTTSPPDWAVDQVKGNIDIANNLANRGVDALPTMPAPAGMTPEQNQVGYVLQRLNPAGQYNPAAQQGQQLANWQAPGVAAGTGQIDRGAVQNVSTGSVPTADLSGYMNPFTQNVIDASARDINRQNQMALLNVDSQADSQGAYGGGRQGVAQAETNRSYGDVAANTIAGLNQANFSQATQNYQTDQARKLQADLANQGVDYNVANANAGNALNLGAINNNAAIAGAGVRQAGVNGLTNTNSAQNQSQLDQLGALYNYGGAGQGLANQGLQTTYQNALNAFNLPLQNLGIRQNAIPGSVGGTSTQPVFSNQTANGLGLGIGAVGLANSLFGQGGGKGLLSGLNLFG